MAQQTINVGTTANDGTGDSLRNGFIKTNDNFTELYSGKQNTLISGTNIKTINGNSLLGSGDLTITGGISGSGTDNYIPRFNGTTALENSILFDNGTNVGVGTASPVDKLDVNGSFRFRGNTSNFTAVNNSGVIDFVPTSIFPTDPQVRIVALGSSSVGASIVFQTGINSGSITERMRLTPLGKVGIGTSSPSTTLQVMGDFIADSGNSFLNVSSTDYISMGENSGSGIELTGGLATFGYMPGGDFIGVRASGGSGVWFQNDFNNKFGLQNSNNSLFAENGIIQNSESPSNPISVVYWIKIYNNDTGENLYFPIYK
jgi:hypothetical protein